ncbi:MAG: glucose-6-phosphate dehydrogenase [Kiritimatiellia bacterium]
MNGWNGNLSFIVIGASGDLARRKVIPALFALYCQNLLPEKFRVIGFARTEMTDAAFRESITANLTCRYTPGESCAERMDEFLSRCFYRSGHYDSRESFQALYTKLKELEGPQEANRIFYLAVPPSIFHDIAHALGGAGLVRPAGGEPWTRVVIEKPFGTDRASSDELSRQIRSVFDERQIFRIDHYLGKEVIQNLMVLRFANLIFEPIWNRLYVDKIFISWAETIGIEGRAGYFDGIGVIRDVMQNHLLQMLALVTMEQPVSLAKYVREEKVKVLRSIQPVMLDDMVLGQYAAGGKQRGYREEPGVPADSITPTYAMAVLCMRSRRWSGVPFILSAGKALDHSMTEIRIQFKRTAGHVFLDKWPEGLPPNELVIRVQPDESIKFGIMNKVPGLGLNLEHSELNLRYASAFEGLIPEAYESLLLDVMKGEPGLFICEDELEASWDVFTPVLHEIDKKRIAPEPYAFGSAGPASAQKMLAKFPPRW